MYIKKCICGKAQYSKIVFASGAINSLIKLKMGAGKALSVDEICEIMKYFRQNIPIAEMCRRLKRSRKVIKRFLANPVKYRPSIGVKQSSRKDSFANLKGKTHTQVKIDTMLYSSKSHGEIPSTSYIENGPSHSSDLDNDEGYDPNDDVGEVGVQHIIFKLPNMEKCIRKKLAK